MANTRLYWLYTLSPTHCGIGRGLGYIDLPIERDGVTEWPIIRGSAFKGVWADHHRATEDARGRDPVLRAAFGTAGADNGSNSGSLIPTDARLVCLPVRSFHGTFAWATSPLCLQMLHRTLTLAGVSGLPDAPPPLEPAAAHHHNETVLARDGKVYLEDLDFESQPCSTATGWAERIAEFVFAEDPTWADQFKRRFIVLPDPAFDFLCATGTEIHTRIRVDNETGTVASGALWNEESLPAESILVGVIQCDRVYQRKEGTQELPTATELLQTFAKEPVTLQIGGHATIGRGQVRCVFAEVQ